MSEHDDELRFRRILVALDASHDSLAALEAAVDLASSLEAELQGLFVEDVNLLRVAGLAVARETRYPFTTIGRLDPARMERQLRAQAARARRALAAACEQNEIRWSFRVVRGEVASEVLEASLDADLLSLGKASRPLIRRARTGSTARAVVAEASGSVLLLPRGGEIRAPMVVPYDGSRGVRPALMVAARLARKKGRYLVILLLTDTLERAQRLQAQASDRLRGEGLVIRYRRLAGAGVATLIEAARTEGSGLLVLSDAVVHPGGIQKLLDRVDCPVLLVR